MNEGEDENEGPIPQPREARQVPDTFWPEALAHWGQPYDRGGSNYVVIGEYSTQSLQDVAGARIVSVALVPPGRAAELVAISEGTGYKVEAHGPRPVVDGGQIHKSGFWLEGVEHGERFEPLINAWSADNHEVILPSNDLLMVYGLVPRYLADGTISWDDLYRPVYDVVRCRSVINGSMDAPRGKAFVEIRREYLSDYCSLKSCSAVAFYFEERRPDHDVSIISALHRSRSEDFLLPGRLLNLQVLPGRSLFCQVWGRAMVLTEGHRQISDEGYPELVWPGHEGPMTYERAAGESLYGYVADKVLLKHQSDPAFTIYPESGGVSYSGQWSVGYTDRIGRNFIRVELKKLYEGCPPGVIAEWHSYAVGPAVAEADRERYGTENISTRARALVKSFLRLTAVLERLSERLGLVFTQEDIGVYSTADVEYRAWWGVSDLAAHGGVALVESSQGDFLRRCVLLQKLIEALKPASLRNVLNALTLPKAKTNELGSLKLLGALCQVATLTRDGGYDWPEEGHVVAPAWDSTLLLRPMASLFALVQLRLLESHRTDNDFEEKLAKQCAVFGIDPSGHKNGWGVAIDTMYERLTATLIELADLLNPD